MWWDSFLHLGNGVAIYVEPDKTEADSLQLFTNASGSWALAPTSMVIGFGVTGSHTNASHSVPSSGWNYSPSWLLPAHGVPSGLGYASTSIVTTSPFPGLVKTVHKTALIHATVPNPVLWGSPAQFHHPHSHSPDRLNSITDAYVPEITYPCSLLLPPRHTLDQYQLHTTGPRSELTSPTPTGQSCSPIYENYSIGIRCYQVLPGTKETVTLFAAHLSLSLHSKTIRCVW